MLERSFGLLFFLKQSKTKSKTARYIYLRITVDGIAKEFSTKRTWTEDRWSQDVGRALGNKEDAKTVNAYLDTLTAKVYRIKAELLETGKQITAEAIKDYLQGKVDAKKMILELFAEHNAEMKALEGREFAPGTVQRYAVCLTHTRNFMFWKYGRNDMEIGELDYEFIEKFCFYLRTVRNCDHNSTMKYLANFKKIVLSCVKKGWLPRDPFLNFSLARKPVERLALSQSELQRIASKEIELGRLEAVRDCFMFCCYTGLAYIDAANLKQEHIVRFDDGTLWIDSKRQKTGSPVRLPLLPAAYAILEKYNEHPCRKDHGQILPISSNQKMNAYLKEIQTMCGITKELTFHIARHTFATTVTLRNGVPIETVSKMLGHSSIKQTQHYAKMCDERISKDMNALAAILNT
ncbi:site-specific integrase [Pedobacter deserti]|uniref:site-specific integrase n=1 Tax=Pedobacter deserti TaxID=2817382 RepID=UPI00210E5DE0|nr:site-specific integrase [Pedobacter sp. SYSU D00382]